MIRSSTYRLLALAAGIAVVMSCDSGAPSGLDEFDPNAPSTGTGTGGGATTIGGDGRFPTIAIDTPTAGQLANVGDSILVAVRVRDNSSGIKSIAVSGLTVKGDPNVGTQVITDRYTSVTAELPAGTAVRSDTVIRRILYPRTPLDTIPDSVVVRAIVTDHSGLVDTVTQVVRVVAGPRVVIISPTQGDSIRPGTRLVVQFSAAHPDGVAAVTVRVRGGAGWPTPLDASFPFTSTTGDREIRDSVEVVLPADAPARSPVTITAEAVDVNRTPGFASPVTVRIRATEAGIPIVSQVVPSRAELSDSVTISANGGNGIVTIGLIARSATDSVSRSITLPGTASTITMRMSMALPPSMQGQRVTVTSYATDRNGRTGYSVSATSNTAVDNLASARSDTVLVAYGRTFALPRSGTAGDVAVDPLRGRVFVSNTRFNRLEVWQASSATFDPNGVAVGAEPWGMTLAANNASELLVANSGGTNISRVNIGSATVSGIGESSRILTRNTIAYTVRETRDPETNKIRIQVTGPFSYSDRPQYIAQSAGGRIYYSTKPTPTAPAGSIRYLDPAQAVPDSRQVYQYGAPATGLNEYAIFNIDAVRVNFAPADSPISDELVLCDHATGTASGSVCASSQGGILAAMTALRSAVATDAQAVAVDVASLALTDTTFVSWSGDRNWIAFGEGNTGGAARVMLARDPAGIAYEDIFFSPGLDVSDLVDNAAEPVFGLALDTAGRSLAVHGTKSYFGAVEQPFHLRMQGEYDTFDAGAGVAFHPQANVDPASPGALNDPTRLVFVASENGTIEIVDAYYFVSRGRITIKNKLYGPLRASLPLNAAEIAAGVAVKLYGLTDQGLVVVDVTTADIRNVP